MNEERFLKDGIIFNEKPNPVPYNYRISYKVSLICLVISLCCGRKGCSLVKMHMLSTALSNDNEKEKLKLFCKSNLYSNILIRFDPVVNRAMTYALREQLILQQANGLFRLTDKGKIITKRIIDDNKILINEKSFLRDVSINLTEDKISYLVEMWGNRSVNN